MASEGIELNLPEMAETDPYAESRKQPLRTYKTPSSFDKLKQFLELDRKVLRFFCVWDDRDSMFGEMRPCVSAVLNSIFCKIWIYSFLLVLKVLNSEVNWMYLH